MQVDLYNDRKTVVGWLVGSVELQVLSASCFLCFIAMSGLPQYTAY